MRIAIGNDHAGISFKNAIKEHLEQKGFEVVNVGTNTPESVDYPDYSRLVAKEVLEHQDTLGILICGTGIGISIAANKIRGIRCAHATDPYSAAMARVHNDANIIALGARITGIDLALMIVDSWVSSAFEGGRHQRRVDKINEIDATGKY